MLSQEELNRQFPLEAEPEIRYCVRWYISKKDPNKQIVLVYDKQVQKVVYRGKTADRHDQYPYIQRFYGKSNCDPPKEIDPKLYFGM